jgi:[ribosomal protein S18]-alanine N-acetyltransferase
LTDVGLKLRPHLTGRGLGGPFLAAGLHFAAATMGAERFTLRVASFNRRAISVYERAGFREVERFQHSTGAGTHAFVRMTLDTSL